MTKPSPKPMDAIVSETLSVIDLLESIPHTGEAALADYKTVCLKIPDHIRSGLIRIAVVGVIKSGKSTFINALTQKELVKRGAGVVTSITTRIRKGKKNKASIHFKSWDEINYQIGKTLDMFPGRPETQFDMRRKKDRTYLEGVYKTLREKFPVTGEGIRPETLLLRNALEGYEACKDIVGADEDEICFISKDFDKHKLYTADPARAFYVKDVCLEVFGKIIDAGIEIADCQGADSTDPAQLAQIISYIESSNLIVYCISSRTGLRQSDMVFLRTIKRLGLIENILFVNNCDLTEHENLADLKNIEARIQDELLFLTPQPRLFTFSALYNLFDAMGNKLSQRNLKRFSLWQDDSAMADHCNEHSLVFMTTFGQLLKENQYNLLFSNHLERIRMVTQALDQKINIVTKLLRDDLAGENRAKDQLKEIEENALRLRAIVDNSIEGAVSGLTQEIESNLSKAFLKDAININHRVRNFIRDTTIDVEPYRAGIKETGFKQVLYLMFQDFKRQLDLFALEQILPELKALVAAQEKRIESYFQSLLDSYQIDFLTLGSRMGTEAESFSLQLIEKDPGQIKAVDIRAIKQILGLELPEKIFTARFTTRMRANALTDLGFHSVFLFVSAMLDKHVRFSFTPGFNKAANKIKKESTGLVRQQIKGYHKTLKSDYFSPLIQAVTRDFKEKILQRFSLYESLNQDMDQLLALKQEEKLAHQEKLNLARDNISCIIKALDEFSWDKDGSDV